MLRRLLRLLGDQREFDLSRKVRSDLPFCVAFARSLFWISFLIIFFIEKVLFVRPGVTYKLISLRNVNDSFAHIHNFRM